jgi:hypothetical protein
MVENWGGNRAECAGEASGKVVPTSSSRTSIAAEKVGRPGEARSGDAKDVQQPLKAAWVLATAWKGNKDVGEGSMVITDAKPPEELHLKLDDFRADERPPTAERVGCGETLASSIMEHGHRRTSSLEGVRRCSSTWTR